MSEQIKRQALAGFNVKKQLHRNPTGKVWEVLAHLFARLLHCLVIDLREGAMDGWEKKKKKTTPTPTQNPAKRTRKVNFDFPPPSSL